MRKRQAGLLVSLILWLLSSLPVAAQAEGSTLPRVWPTYRSQVLLFQVHEGNHADTRPQEQLTLASGDREHLSTLPYSETDPSTLISSSRDASVSEGSIEPAGPAVIRPAETGPTTFQWEGAVRQSFYFLSVEHAFRMVQKKTRREFAGPFFGDYFEAVRGVGGWGDGDGVFTNYVGHPMQGAISGYIQIHNDPLAKKLEFNEPGYWSSRMKAFAWSAAYSTQFELGPYSEAMFGNVGKKPGTAGWVDLIMTPTGGLGMIVAEDAVDKLVIKRRFERDGNENRWARTLLNPNRSLANLLRGKVPWHRD